MFYLVGGKNLAIPMALEIYSTVIRGVLPCWRQKACILICPRVLCNGNLPVSLGTSFVVTFLKSNIEVVIFSFAFRVMC